MLPPYFFSPGSTHPFFYHAPMSSFVTPSVYQHPTLPCHGPSTDSEGHNTHSSQEHEQAIAHYASQTNAEDASNAGAVADAQGDMLQCMLSTGVSPFGERIRPCREGFADLDDLVTHLRDRHGVRGSDHMRLNCLWLTNGVHLCGKNIRKGGYKRHISAHLRLRVVCEVCGQSFSRKDTLNNHMKEKHRVEQK